MKCNNDLASITTTNFSNSKLDIQIVKKSVEFKNSPTYNGLISNPLSLGSFSQTFLLTILVLGILCLSTTCSTTIYSSHRWVQNKKILEEKPSSSFSMRHFDSWEVWVVSKSRFESLSFSPSLSLTHTHTRARTHTCTSTPSHMHARALTLSISRTYKQYTLKALYNTFILDFILSCCQYTRIYFKACAIESKYWIHSWLKSSRLRRLLIAFAYL